MPTAYYRMPQILTAEFYWKDAILATGNRTDEASLMTYAKSASYLTNLLCRDADYSGALKLALPVVSRLEQLSATLLAITAIARDLQMSMVPRIFPKCEGLDMYASMAPAKEVGGDLYGYLLQGDMLYFCIGDVSGKGVPASLFMAQGLRLFHILASQGMQPAEIATLMNEEFTENNEQGMFVTMFIGLLNLKTGHLDFCNAGHNYPVIGGGESQGDFLHPDSNAPIGFWPGYKYKGEELDSIKGRPFFLYTDGLNEAENMQQERLGDERLLELLRATRFENSRQVIDTLAAAVEQHRNGAEPNDDLTMMCIKL